MQTRKLYYEDAHLSEFTAQVMTCEKTDNGFEVTLDATAFYPEGGGQAGDTGYLGDIRVLDAQEQGETIVHLCSGRLEIGATVKGRIDWDARFLRMQQHSGEHIVSGIVNRRYGYHNVGFHMGADVITIDFDGVIPEEDLASIEAEANSAVWANLPIRCWVPTPEELPDVVYRSKRALPWPVRIVEVPGFDSCACCGTHVKATGEIGLIKLFGTVGFRGGTRMEMACGKRALEILNGTYAQNKLVSQAFSAQIMETGTAAYRMNELLEKQKFRIVGLERQIFAMTAQRYTGKGNVVHFAEGLDSTGLRELTDAIAKECGGMAAVFSGSDTEGYGYCLAAKGADLRPFGKEMTKALNGRGGGKPGFQQGRVMAEQAAIQSFFARHTVSQWRWVLPK